MALDDRQHVEAVAIMRRLYEDPLAMDQEARTAAEIWLRENHPDPSVYVSAVAPKEDGSR